MITGAGKDVQDVARVITTIADKTVLKNGEHMTIKSVYLTNTNGLEAIALHTWTHRDGSEGREWVVGHGFNARADDGNQLQVWWSNGSYGYDSEEAAKASIRLDVCCRVWKEGEQ